MKLLIILRGLPGSGKSTFANEIWSKEHICEADDYFYNRAGVYNFDASKLNEAHKWCQQQVEEKMMVDMWKIVVSNTSTTEKELEPYYKLAEIYDYKVVSLIVENRHNGINQHGVPNESLNKMKKRFDVKL